MTLTSYRRVRSCLSNSSALEKYSLIFNKLERTHRPNSFDVPNHLIYHAARQADHTNENTLHFMPLYTLFHPVCNDSDESRSFYQDGSLLQTVVYIASDSRLDTLEVIVLR